MCVSCRILVFTFFFSVQHLVTNHQQISLRLENMWAFYRLNYGSRFPCYCGDIVWLEQYSKQQKRKYIQFFLLLLLFLLPMWHVSLYNFWTYTLFLCNRLRVLAAKESLAFKTLALNPLSFVAIPPCSTTASSFLLITSDAAIFPH